MKAATKLSYGVGEAASEVPNSLLSFFLLFFLTNVAGLPPAWAGSVLLVSRIWDAVSDPVVGWLSDRTRSRWGRRYPWMVAAAIPMGLAFAGMWWVPPLAQSAPLFAYYCAVTLLFYAASTAVVVPHSTLGAELTQGYDERTGLLSYQAAFSIGSSILGLGAAQAILALLERESDQYLLLGMAGGLVATLAAYVAVGGTWYRYHQMQWQRAGAQPASDAAWPLLQQFRVAFRNRPFLLVMGIYWCSWVGLQVTAAMLPYFVQNWMSLPERHFTQMALAVQGTALASMVAWNWLGQRTGKRAIYGWGIPITLVAQAGLFLLQPGQLALMYALGILAGLGLATAYLVPWAMLPDAVDWDELHTGQRREGVFYGAFVQMKKIGTAIALFLVGQVLDWAGFVTQSGQAGAPEQPESALWAIRSLTALIPSLVLAGGLILVALYPINRERHQQIRMQLLERARASPR